MSEILRRDGFMVVAFKKDPDLTWLHFDGEHDSQRITVALDCETLLQVSEREWNECGENEQLRPRVLLTFGSEIHLTAPKRLFAPIGINAPTPTTTNEE